MFYVHYIEFYIDSRNIYWVSLENEEREHFQNKEAIQELQK